MKALFIILILLTGLLVSGASAEEKTPGDRLSPQEEQLLEKCNLEARNALVHEDLELVEKLCMQAVQEIDKSHENKELLVNPLMNLAFSYTLAGQFDKATPLYERARSIRAKLFGPDSLKTKEIEKRISDQEELVKNRESLKSE